MSSSQIIQAIFKGLKGLVKTNQSFSLLIAVSFVESLVVGLKQRT